jgi:hypothetical protein
MLNDKLKKHGLLLICAIYIKSSDDVQLFIIIVESFMPDDNLLISEDPPPNQCLLIEPTCIQIEIDINS